MSCLCFEWKTDDVIAIAIYTTKATGYTRFPCQVGTRRGCSLCRGQQSQSLHKYANDRSSPTCGRARVTAFPSRRLRRNHHVATSGIESLYPIQIHPCGRFLDRQLQTSRRDVCCVKVTKPVATQACQSQAKFNLREDIQSPAQKRSQRCACPFFIFVKSCIIHPRE